MTRQSHGYEHYFEIAAVNLTLCNDRQILALDALCSRRKAG